MYKYEFRGKKYTEQDIAGQAAEVGMSVKDYLEIMFASTSDFKLLDNPEPITSGEEPSGLKDVTGRPVSQKELEKFLEETDTTPTIDQDEVETNIGVVREFLESDPDDIFTSNAFLDLKDEKYEDLTLHQQLSKTYDIYGDLDPEKIEEINKINGIKQFILKNKKLPEKERLDGSLSFLTDKKISKDFFRQDKEYSIQQLKTYFSDDYEIKLNTTGATTDVGTQIADGVLPGQRLVEGIVGGIVGDIYDADLVQITHRKSGESINVRLGIKPSIIGIDSEEYKEKESNFIEEQAKELFDFIGSTITTGEKEKASVVQEEMLGEYAEAYRNSIRITNQRRSEIKKRS